MTITEIRDKNRRVAPRKNITRESDRVLKALTTAIKEPGPVTSRRAAEALVSLRQQFEFDGRPDWTGRSIEYRDIIERLYRQAGVPADSEGGMQANLRYHLGNVLREVAPAEDLQALGISVDGPAGRIRRNRKEHPKARTTNLDSRALAGLALSAVHALASSEPGPEIESTLRQILDETVNILAGIRSN